MRVDMYSSRVSQPSGRPTSRRRFRTSVIPARGSDHTAIYYFLKSIFRAPTREQFNASLEDPFYEPSDRLLIQRGETIAAHVQLVPRTMQFGALKIPVAELAWLAVAPQNRSRGAGRHLLQVAEKQMAEEGAVLGLLRTSIPHYFRKSGWAFCGRTTHSQVHVRALLARLIDLGLQRRSRPRFKIRPWRYWEEAALARIYSGTLKGSYGKFDRTEAYWSWLTRRQTHDQIYVALDGPQLLELGEISTRIVGYAITRGESILELATAPDHRKAAAELLARFCSDSIEQNRHCISLHAPPSSKLHRLFGRAGGKLHRPPINGGEVQMIRILNPLKMLRMMGEQFRRRAQKAGLRLPVDLGLAVDQKKYQIEVTDTGTTVASRRIGRSYLQMNIADFTRLVLGQLDWDETLADGRLFPSTALAREVGRVLFPPLPLWQSPLDVLHV